MDYDEMMGKIERGEDIDLTTLDKDEVAVWARVNMECIAGWAEHIAEHFRGREFERTEDDEEFSNYACAIDELTKLILCAQNTHGLVWGKLLSEDDHMELVKRHVEQRTGIPVKEMIRTPLGLVAVGDTGELEADTVEGLFNDRG